MNRIRKHNNLFQVLVTPTHDFNTDIEILLGSWTDTHLRNYYVLNFDTLADAQCEAFKYPDINWEKVIIMYKGAYTDLTKLIKQDLDKHKFIVEFEQQIMSPEVLKNTVFDRVISFGKKFFSFRNLNDVLSFRIVNPWSKNLQEIARILEMNPKLKLVKKTTKQHVIQLVGKTDLGTTYEIVLWPTLLFQWMKFIHKNPHHGPNMRKMMFQKAITMQNAIDQETLFI